LEPVKPVVGPWHGHARDTLFEWFDALLPQIHKAVP
jgi:hypothetical protein